MTPKVVVGLDSSPAAETALSWSFEVASCYGAELEAVHAWLLQIPDPLPLVMDLPLQLAAIARSTVDGQLERAVARRAAGAAPVHVSVHTAEGDPGPALVTASTDAQLLVVGRHGQSNVSLRLVGPVLGSVAAHCLSRSSTPVVVVPHGARPGTPRRVIVGVDGSDASARALKWAHEHALVVGSELVAVLTWQLTTLPAPSSWTAGAVPQLRQWHARAEHLLATVCDATLGADAQDVEQVVLDQPVAVSLMAAVTSEDLLVVGDRGRGGFSRLLLGSVSRQCAEHATSPVVVVPSPDRLAAAGA